MNRSLKSTVSALVRTGLGPFMRAASAWRGVLGLCYHRIGEPARSPFDHGLWSATPEGFDAQVRLLVKNFDVIGTDDLPDAVARRRGRLVVITFDDGYRDNYDVAFPILRSLGAVAVFFLATRFLDRPQLPWWDEMAWMVRRCPLGELPAGPWRSLPVPFDDPTRERAVRVVLRAYKALPHDRTAAYLEALGEATGCGRYRDAADDLWMTWDMVREMRRGGMCFGGHTASHPVLARLSRDGQAAELAECRARIEAELGEPMTSFSYPNGYPDDFNSDTRACLADEGVALAFSYYGGWRTFEDWDPYDVRRAPVELWHSFGQFRAMTTVPKLFL